MTKLFKIFVISFLAVSVENIVAGCEQTLVEPLRSNLARQNSSKSLIGYLQKALEEHAIGQAELFRLIEKLKDNILENPITKEQAMLDGQLQIHEKNIQSYIDKGDVDLTELLLWAENNLIEENRVRKSREETREVTQEPYQKIYLNPLPANIKFKIGRKKRFRFRRAVTLTNRIEMMDTPVTQYQWIKVMGENPSQFVEGEYSENIK